MSDLTAPSDEHSLLNDRDLLRRFVQDADELAFAEIVRRHQGLVMGVCRRVIGDAADVDDAFQATFIALARRPRQIRQTASLSSWLYTVAWRTSLRLVRQRRKHPVEPLTNHPLAEQTDPLDRIASAQDCLVLDEELNILPAKYREVLVMTYFSGQGSQQIADQLHVSKGIIDGRIREARNMLRIRLARRGVAIGVLAVAAGLSSGPQAVAAGSLLDATIHLGAQTLTDSLPGTTDLSHLEPFIRPETTMLSTKLLLSAALCATALAGLAGMNGFVSGRLPQAGADSVTPIDTAVATTDAVGQGSSALLPVTFTDPGPAAVVPAAMTSEMSAVGDFGAAAAGGPPYKPYPADARPVERWMYEIMEQPVPLLDFPGDTPLTEVLKTIAEHFTTTYGTTDDDEFQLTLWLDKRTFEQEGFSDLADIYVSDIRFEGMTLQNALGLIFEQTKEPDLAYEIRNEVLCITTQAQADSDESLVTRVYNVDHLLDVDLPVRSSSGGMMPTSGVGVGMFSVASQTSLPTTSEPGGNPQPQSATPAQFPPSTATAYTLAELVQEMTSPPCRWMTIDGEGGAIKIVGRSLVVRQTQAGHREIVRLLNLLTESISTQN